MTISSFLGKYRNLSSRVEANLLCDAARELCDLQAMSEPRVIVASFARDNDLTLAGKAPESTRVDDSIAIVLGPASVVVRLRNICFVRSDKPL